MTAGVRGRASLRAQLRAAGGFVRFQALGGTLVLVLIGASSTGARPSSGALVALLVVATHFHLFAYVLNDVVDLPIDRTEPRRSHSPLVTGTVKPSHALLFALVQVPAALVLARTLPGGAEATTALASAFVLLAAYDLYGKRCPVPPLTDLVQGAGWAALVLFGASAAGGITVAGWATASFVVVFIVMANGVHGSLRDLANDWRCGVRSTAIWLGARPGAPGTGAGIPRRVIRYAWALHVALLGMLVVPLAAGSLGYTSAQTAAAGVGLVLVGTLTSWLLVAAVRGAGDWATFHSAGMLHLVVMLLGPGVLLGPGMDARMRGVVSVAFAVPLLTHPRLPMAVRWFSAAIARRMPFGAVLQLIRVQNCLAASAATVLGGYLTGAERWFTGRLAVAAAAVCALVMAANALNDRCDVAVDRTSSKDRPIPSGRVSMATASRLAAISALTGLLLSALLGWGFLAASLILALLAAAYCQRLKSTVLVGNAVIGLLSGATLVFGAAATGRVTEPVVVAAVLVGLFIVTGEVLKCVADAPADAALGLRTVATMLPRSTVVRVHWALAALTCGAAVGPWLTGIAPTRFVLAILPAALAPTVTVSVLLAMRPDPRLMRVLLYVTKFAWATGLLALTQLR